MPFKRLTEGHSFCQFDCGDSDLNSFLLDDAINYQKQLLSVTYYVDTADKTV